MRIFNSVLVALIWAAIIYIAAAFCEWSFNPKDWFAPMRWVVAIFGILLGSIIAVYYYDTSEDNLKK